MRGRQGAHIQISIVSRYQAVILTFLYSLCHPELSGGIYKYACFSRLLVLFALRISNFVIPNAVVGSIVRLHFKVAIPSHPPDLSLCQDDKVCYFLPWSPRRQWWYNYGCFSRLIVPFAPTRSLLGSR